VLGTVDVPPAPGDFDIEAAPKGELRRAGLDMAAFYLSGSIAEALANGLRLNAHKLWIDQPGEPDLANARRVLKMAGFQGDDGLLYAGHVAERMLMFGWRHVLAEAEHIARKPPEVVQ